MNSIMTEQRREELKAALKSGMPIEKIMKAHKATHKTVVNVRDGKVTLKNPTFGYGKRKELYDIWDNLNWRYGKQPPELLEDWDKTRKSILSGLRKAAM